MKVAYQHIINFIPSKPSIDDISKRFFQLGHEHVLSEDIFDMDITPNRGDCLSLKGLLRDLGAFYEISHTDKLYENEIKPLKIDFVNKAIEACPSISFLKIETDGKIKPYQGALKNYFENLEINKNNFFTDVSNYISYETGQPTHCYDSRKIKDSFSLEMLDENCEFETLLDKKIKLNGNNLVFMQDNSVINLAGIMGGINTACTEKTTSTIVECAYFNPESIIGKTIKYDINSDAAHKFERGVDPLCHERVLRRFISVVEEHTNITNIEITQKEYKKYKEVKIPFSLHKINKILGMSLSKDEMKGYLSKLSFKNIENEIIVPSCRGDVRTHNDIAEEIARIIGYDNIPTQQFCVPNNLYLNKSQKFLEKKIKDAMVYNGFFEVINNPFVKDCSHNSITLDNPLDINKSHMRTNLKNSLINNLLYNEKRQQDSIKLFEIADVYYSHKEEIRHSKMLGIICSGRVGRNYEDFSKIIDVSFLSTLLKKTFPDNDINPIIISRENLESKQKNEIVYFEIELDKLNFIEHDNYKNQKEELNKDNFTKYIPVSQYPSSIRDLSFAVKDIDKFYELQNFLLNYKEDLIKEIFVFDFYNNERKNEIKIGFRFIFQSSISTITEKQVTQIMNKIISETLSIESVEIPGFKT